MRTRPVLAGSLVAFSMLLGMAAAEASPSVPNDRPEDAVRLAIPGAYEQRTTDATADGEPYGSCASLGATVWFRLPARPEPTSLSTSGSDFDTVIEVFREAPDGLELVACDDNSGDGSASLLSLPAGEEEFLVRVGGRNDNTGALRIEAGGRLAAHPDEIHAGPDEVVQVEALPYRATGHFRPFAGDPCERSTDVATPRFRVEPEQRMVLRIRENEARYWFAVYRNGVLLDCRDAWLDHVEVEAGATYEVQAVSNDGWWPESTRYDLQITAELAPANDHRSDAEAVIVPSTQWVDTLGATSEPDERQPCGMTASVWFAFEATETGQVVIDVSESSNGYSYEYDSVAAIFRDSDGGPTLLACNDDASGDGSPAFVFADVVEGERYLVQVGGYLGSRGEASVQFAYGNMVEVSAVARAKVGRRGLGVGGCVDLWLRGGACEFVPF